MPSRDRQDGGRCRARHWYRASWWTTPPGSSGTSGGGGGCSRRPKMSRGYGNERALGASSSRGEHPVPLRVPRRLSTALSGARVLRTLFQAPATPRGRDRFRSPILRRMRRVSRTSGDSPASSPTGGRTRLPLPGRDRGWRAARKGGSGGRVEGINGPGKGRTRGATSSAGQRGMSDTLLCVIRTLSLGVANKARATVGEVITNMCPSRGVARSLSRQHRVH